ncbi:aspartate aminotransferase family protein [Nocardia bovistercoris]|uniref:Aspartate aminotransferase family protein n=1 Tax=Nocardia bovistercoris TaxID=2785916 RepID=A0A931N716_9NOCA|nr:aminotransferase class III-fold pyridoxal phosphate-dependent enzyme [Nocardia bovistercoris]MBH0781579.1 aspartate aminotransferase family protein [Nocardia bovistercoris]
MTETQLTSDYDRVAATYRRNLSSGRARLADMLGGHLEVESKGAWITVADGQHFLNVGGYGVFITGARHPIVVAEVERQLHSHPISSRLFLEPALGRAAQMLTATTPPGLNRVHFCNSGAEATEAAIKLARLNQRPFLISTVGGYHGKTMGALSVTGRSVFQDPFRPLLPDVAHVPFGDTAALAAVLREHPEQACVILEPVQAEAGVVLPPPGYLAAVQSLCAEYGALFVLDEVQTGLGRLGLWWGAERESIRPDVLLSGKGLGGAVMPVAAVIATDEVFSGLDRDPLLHTSTFSGAPIAMAAVCGALRAIEEDGLVERAARLGEILLREITRIVDRYLSDLGARVRGSGLLIAVDIAEPGVAGELLIELVKNNVVANLSMNSDFVLRFTPPAVLSDNEVDFFLNRFEVAARATAQYGNR